MTFGSPLRRLYARNFPAYFGTGALPRLSQRQSPRWINLWARSDPIGSWVNDGVDRTMAEAPHGVDFRLLDVESLAPKRPTAPIRRSAATPGSGSAVNTTRRWPNWSRR